jgi:hypothetical protein
MTDLHRNALTLFQEDELINTLKIRFEKNMNRHKDFNWDEIHKKLEKNSIKLWSLSEMERTGGEPDVVDYDSKTDEYIFFDCVTESPIGRRSLCYDKAALDARKENKPVNSAINMASTMGLEILDEEQYRFLQKLGKFDLKTSSWLKTNEQIRKLGGAIFADFRYDTVFIYHNGAQSYYSGRGYRCFLKI